MTVATKPTVKKSLKYERDKMREKVKGIFKFYEVPGGNLSFCYKEFKEDDVEKYSFTDGQIYEIPLGVARHLNKNGWYPRHRHTLDASGNPLVDVGSKVRRFGFQSLEFVDIEDITPVGVPENAVV